MRTRYPVPRASLLIVTDVVVDARWRKVEDGESGLVMRLVDHGALVGQCSITALPIVEGATPPTRAEVVHKAFRGAEILYTLKLSSGRKVLALVPSHHNHALGEQIGIRLDVDHALAARNLDLVPIQPCDHFRCMEADEVACLDVDIQVHVTVRVEIDPHGSRNRSRRNRPA